MGPIPELVGAIPPWIYFTFLAMMLLRRLLVVALAVVAALTSRPVGQRALRVLRVLSQQVQPDMGAEA